MVRIIRKLYNKFISEDKDLVKRLYPIIGFIPVNMEIFKIAFSHKSTPAEKSSAVTNNERLEYLGDAVLGTIVAEYLFKKYPTENEGFLTKMRSKIVKRKSLNKIGEKMELDILLSKYNKTRLSNSMLGNAVEALVGAVYLENGYDGTMNFVVRKILRNYIDVDELETTDDNYKSQLLEWCQKNGKSVSYRLVARYKLDKRDRFKVAVMVDNQKFGTADDYNKKAAEQTASREALIKIGVMIPVQT